MSREIKFKASRFGEVFDVLEWDFTGHPDRQSLLLGKDGKEYIRESIKNLDVMQYTGLKDKTGKEVYEGDIIDDNWIRSNGSKVYNFNWAVKFGEHETSLDYYASTAHGFYLDELDNDSEYREVRALPWTISEGEVIGNIYENPELIQGDENVPDK